MKLLMLGASGNVGSVVLDEAVSRGHHVVALVRDLSRAPAAKANVEWLAGDATDPASIGQHLEGVDAVLMAVGPGTQGNAQVIVKAANAVVAALDASNVKRVIVVGGAGSLEVAPGVTRLDAPGYPDFWRPQGVAQLEALGIYRASSLDWTYLSPPPHLEPGERTGRYRTGGDTMVEDANGRSHISVPDYAVALIDELEQPKHVKRRFTVGY